MRRILLVVALLLLAADAHAIIIIGGSGAAPEPPAGDNCTSQAADVSITTDETSSIFYSATDRGQSWKAGVTRDLYSLSFRRYNDTLEGAETLVIRIGTSSDLSSSYLIEYTCTVPNANGTFECVVPTPRPSLTSGTTYYAIMQSTSNWSIRRASSSVYADGSAFYDTTADYVGTAATTDLYFITKMCD